MSRTMTNRNEAVVNLLRVRHDEVLYLVELLEARTYRLLDRLFSEVSPEKFLAIHIVELLDYGRESIESLLRRHACPRSRVVVRSE